MREVQHQKHLDPRVDAREFLAGEEANQMR